MKRTIFIIISIMFLFNFQFMSKKQLLSRTWVYETSVDSYKGGIWYPRDSSNIKYLVFHINGTYEEYDNQNHWSGEWKLNSKETKIGLLPLTYNDSTLSTKGKFSFDWNITSLTLKELKFWIQGRHGAVSYTYKSIE